MFDPNFSSVLYKDSPFLPIVDQKSDLRVFRLVVTGELYPAVAIAKEIRSISSIHTTFLRDQRDWLAEKFDIAEDNLLEYLFGLITPPTLIVGADLYSYRPPEEILSDLLPPPDSKILEELWGYLESHLATAYKLVNFTATSPITAADPVYRHCNFEIFSDQRWYLVGLRVSYHLFRRLSQPVYPYPNFRSRDIS
ncbi:MAG: hypothetical protein UW68_C0061G0002 [Candidatus Collierbacteria bacterium GW2011_GWB1_44_6]|uniref:Uncharacterized protein n=2 Tax=Candidatus Collieribacteriota TaxID=1752725 RepID=A0A0G1JJ58_9BACT|nr:MAG: hypothetical protein UV68_C0066G0004 [Candidatus Collierbacteria bacterium GW2011_GWC2_43_12]KKT71596.1 MAG: hypothetical protein UW68_C0061G0002 [Candidatus Collierbacteria bacterium GW2011_GWB1_44_6]KKT81280.1 MAG: hypothetical protein UW80_C0054G0004 [Microgenomates group bacterium GW2011_GWC1_44_9]